MYKKKKEYVTKNTNNDLKRNNLFNFCLSCTQLKTNLILIQKLFMRILLFFCNFLQHFEKEI